MLYMTDKLPLPIGILKAFVTSHVFCYENGIKILDETIFTYCLIESSKERLYTSLGRDEINLFLETLKSKITIEDTPISFNQVTLNKRIFELLYKCLKEKEDINVEHVLYFLLKSNTKLKKISIISGISLNKILVEINRMYNLNKKEEKPKINKKDYISKFCTDYNQKAIDGELNPIFCRDSEIDHIIVSLLKKNNSNPILIGEPGVGKSVIVEGLAKRLVDGNVPERLKGYRIFSLQMCSLVQGTNLRGQFEERIEEILKAILEDKKIILFIDEIHTLVGAGVGSDNSLDASNIMKPYLSRGDFKCIGATTFDDYHKYMMRDKALLRRFQKIFISETNDHDTEQILRGLSVNYKNYHNCSIEDSVYSDIIRLSRRFVLDRFFPDKAVDCLDHACAKSYMNNNVVDRKLVEEVISQFSDIPIDLIRKSDYDRLSGLESHLKSYIMGNTKSIKSFVNKLKFSFATKANKKGCFCSLILCGPAGIGKKSIVKESANFIYGKGSFIQLNGSELSDASSINRIVGSPPGYICHTAETYFLREVRRKPYLIILIDNPLSMHSSIIEQFRSIIENGSLNDCNGIITDFSNCIIIFSIDMDAKKFEQYPIGFGLSSIDENNKDVIKKDLVPLNFINNVIVFNDKKELIVDDIINSELERIYNDLKLNGVTLDINNDCKEYLKRNSFGSPLEIRQSVSNIIEDLIMLDFLDQQENISLIVENDQINIKR